MQVKRFRMKRGRYKPEQIGPVHDEHEKRDPGENARASLRGPRKQQQERQRELKNNQQDRQIPPAAERPANVPRNLFGEILRPDNEELRTYHGISSARF